MEEIPWEASNYKHLKDLDARNLTSAIESSWQSLWVQYYGQNLLIDALLSYVTWMLGYSHFCMPQDQQQHWHTTAYQCPCINFYVSWSCTSWGVFPLAMSFQNPKKRGQPKLGLTNTNNNIANTAISLYQVCTTNLIFYRLLVFLLPHPNQHTWVCTIWLQYVSRHTVTLFSCNTLGQIQVCKGMVWHGENFLMTHCKWTWPQSGHLPSECTAHDSCWWTLPSMTPTDHSQA